MFWIVIRPSSVLVARPLFHRWSVEHAEPLAHDARLPQFAAQEHVVGDRQSRRQRQLLVDAFDPGFARLDRRLEKHRLAVQRNLAFVGDDGPEIALISEDLPAPLSPMTARISPG
jgi:hypothetical protein